VDRANLGVLVELSDQRKDKRRLACTKESSKHRHGNHEENLLMDRAAIEAFRVNGKKLIDEICDYFIRMEEYPGT
jgi:hypothetical protein